MAWSMPNTGPWNPAMGFPGPYSVKEWTDMQQHNWQEWAQWQQHYSQWQNQYGEKLAQQYQMQHMGNMPLMFPMNPALPPAPPPPNDPPPPPPHENDQPLFAQSAVQPTPVPPPPNQQWNPSNYPSTNAEKTSATNKTSGLNPNWSTINVEPPPQVINMEALKKLAEEERLFDIQFKQWEEEIDKWRKDNINHPDKDAYKEYEKKFETCRAQLMERRNQMKLQRSKLLGNTQPSKTTMQTNTSTSAPQQLSASKKNYNEVTSQNYQNSPMQNYESHNDTNYENQQFNNTYNKNSKNIDPQDRYESYQDLNEDMSYSTSESQPSKNSANFLPTASSNKDIPGLDLVLDSEKTSAVYKNQDVLKIEDKVNNQNAGEKPDYSTISQGINNILGDEKIMNILSMVRNNKPNILSLMENASQSLNFSRDSPHSNIPSYSEDRYQNNPNNQQAHRQLHDYSNQYNQEINPRYPLKRQFDERANIPMQHEQQYDNYQDDQGHDQRPAFYERNVPQDEPPLRQMQARPPFQDISVQNMNNYSRDIPDIRHIQTNIIPPLNQSVKPKWVEEPLFTPSIIVEYEHKPLRLKARDFIEPVHMFDYNHKSKSGSSKKVDYYKEVDELFTKRNHWERDNNETRVQNSSRDFERRSLKENVNDDYHSKVNFERRPLDGRHSDKKYGQGLFDRDRYSQRDDHTRERERDHFRNKGDSRDFARDDKDLKRSDRDFLTDTRDFEREDNRDYKKDISRNSSRDIGRDLSRDVRDMRRDDNRDSRDYKRDSCRTSRDVGRDFKREDSRDYKRSSSNSSRDVSRDYSRDDRDLKHSDGYFKRDDRDFRDYERNTGWDNKHRSRSRERNFRKRSHSHDSDIETVPKVSKAEDVELSIEEMKYIVMIDDLLEPPGREMRPEKIAIILRGVPGSGKSYLAKLIRDKEAEYGGAARIMSIDDYFMQEVQIEEKDPTSGKIIKKPVMKYEYDANLEESYFISLKKAFKRNVTDGYFSFLILDAVNEFLKSYADVWNFSRQNGFQVYVCTMEADVHTCFKRNIHNRSLEDIEALSECFFKTPAHHIQLDATTLLQSAAITEVHMEDVKDDVEMVETQELEVENVFTSKWEKMDSSAQLARLDGTSKPLRSSQLTMEDYLQSDDWKPNLAKPGKKTVRWADIEERRQQEKMRAIGFVVGQTDWNRMTDPTLGSSALTQTKYIERVRRN